MNIALLIIYLVGAVVAMVLQIRVNIKANDSETKQTKFDFFSSVFIAGIMSLFYIFVYYTVMNVEQKYENDGKDGGKDQI